MIISLCTTCMNRIEFLDLTIFRNIRLIKEFNTSNSNKFEISLCNYNSKDNLDKFVSNNLQEYINLGLLRYVKVNNKEYFNMSHSKNIAHKYSTGNVLINFDCDNILNEDVINFIYQTFISYDINKIYLCDSECLGFIGLSRFNFFKLGGYNENLFSYGFDDVDLKRRLEKYLFCSNILLPEYLKYNTNCVIQQNSEFKILNFKKELNGIIYNTINQTTEYNAKISNYYIDNNIMNPNEFEGIDFGKLN
jgi:predicted glycosyltransferase involved in capsule biosynthesis